ncbi:MAG: hypothetical protein U9O90_04545, partial [Euryarchaeota archaeon]|nr:hypothetical protein [Euryarchaeota archaeon]
MRNSLKKITDKVKQLYAQHNEVLDCLIQHCWADTRPLEIAEKEGGIDFDLMIPPRPEEKKLSEKFKLDYQDWYSSSCALLERNYNKERTSEFKSEYENNIKKIISENYIS